MCHCKGDISKLTQKEMVLVHEGKKYNYTYAQGKNSGDKTPGTGSVYSRFNPCFHLKAYWMYASPLALAK